MKPEGVEQLSQALQVLRQQASAIQRLSEAEMAALLSALPSAPECTELRMQLAAQLQKDLQPYQFAHKELGTLFAMLNALHGYDPTLVDGTMLARAAQRLVLSETTVGGPYNSNNGTPDTLTNAQIAVCMQSAGAPLPQVLAFLRRRLAESSGEAVWSNYLLWQTLRMLDDQTIRAWLSDHAPLTKKTLVEDLSAAQFPGMCTEARDLVVAAYIARFLYIGAQDAASAADAGAAQKHHSWQALHDAAFAACAKQLARQSQPMQAHSLFMLEQVRQVDTNYEIGLMPAFFAINMALSSRKKTLVQQLSQANIYAWMAYVIYDDFIDDEGTPSLLSTANVVMRQSLDLYQTALPDDQDFAAFVQQAFDSVDAANAWEVAHCRFPITAEGYISTGALPDFGDLQFLANRALIHALGPLAILRLKGISMDDGQWAHVQQGLRHYLIARQLNDDIHDCFDDLAAGHITYVVAMLLNHVHLRPAIYRIEQLQRLTRGIFWREVLPDIADTAQQHVQQAREAFRRSGLLTESNELYKLLDTIQKTLEDGMAKRTQNQEFLQAFEDSTVN